MTEQPNIHDDRRRSRWIPWLFAAVFGVVLSANGALIYFATSSFTGLQTEGHYQKGLEYNRVLEAARAQEALGWLVSVSFDPAGGGQLQVRATDRTGAPLSGAAVTARLLRPTQAGHDTILTLEPGGDGIYQADLNLPLAGQWEVRTRIGHDTGVYRSAQRIMVR